MDLLKFFHEIGQLKQFPRSGWLHKGVEQPESIADHTFRTAAIAFVLARELDENPHRATSMALFHDLSEARIQDLHGLSQQYLEKEGAVREAFDDIVAAAGDHAEAVSELFDEYEDSESELATIVKDADLLEGAIQAKEYVARGYSTCKILLEKYPDVMET
ncbi:MAG: HD family hydrolase, partial [Candidatus Nanohaloarchaea archaeon]|nr:HD family hydrolase [Candidatus Nanohaloarchaea archaeon]